jgi:dienelactone hydrolase
MLKYRWFGLILFLLAPAVLRADEPGHAYPPPAEVRASFLKLLDRPRVPLDVKSRGATRADGLVTEEFTFATEKKRDGTVERVPILLVRPEKASGKLPAVIVAHGTGGTKEGQKSWLEALARRGIVGAAIDGRYHGERKGASKGTAAYNEAILRAWRASPGARPEYPFYYDTCWDLWRTVDFLQTRDFVNPKKIGMMGFSKGGIETWLAAAADVRVAAAVPAIGVQSFRWSLENNKWQGRANTVRAAHEAAARDLGLKAVNQKVCRALWSKLLPGILDRYDGPSTLRLFAGRPLLILNGENDPNCPLPGAKLAFAAAEKAYREAEASDRLRIMVAEGVGHKVTDEQGRAALAWFDLWLKKE